MQMVFQMEAQNDRSVETMKKLAEDRKLSDKDREYIHSTFICITDHLYDIDSMIERHSKKWKLDRIPKAELAILRTACGEIAYKDDIPASVSINEAVNLAKAFGGSGASSFVNGVLGKIADEADG